MPMDLLGFRCTGVPDEISDGLDGYAAVAHQGHQGVTQLPRRPVLPQPCLLGDRLEGSSDVGRVQRCPRLAGEDEAVILQRLPAASRSFAWRMWCATRSSGLRVSSCSSKRACSQRVPVSMKPQGPPPFGDESRRVSLRPRARRRARAHQRGLYRRHPYWREVASNGGSSRRPGRRGYRVIASPITSR
jgi:hypothetical protein